LSFVFATFAAMWFLGERVSSIRWAGVILIMIGAAFISYSEHAKEKPAPPPATNQIER
jgi:drug/metabolite transporter (DMT)-like permease